MKTSSLPNLNRETISFPNFLTFIQDPADPDDNDTTLNKRPKTNDIEPSETSPFKGILSTSLSSGEMNKNHHRIVEWDLRDRCWPPCPNGSDSNVGLSRLESVQTQHNTSSVGSNQFSGNYQKKNQFSGNYPKKNQFSGIGIDSGSGIGIGSGSATCGSVFVRPNTTTQLWWWDPGSHPDFPESDSRRASKMSKSTFEFICSELDPVINKDYTMLQLAIPLVSHTSEIIPVRQRVAVCIWWLATGEPLHLVSQKFGLGISTCRELVLEVCGAIRSVLMSKFLKWPDEEKMTKVKGEFELISRIPNVGGSMYTMHVPINEPELNAPTYFNNQKMSYSITVQGVVDSKGFFTDVCIGCPGSMSDYKILMNSALSQRASGGLLKDVWIVGNSGYPEMDWVLVPYAHKPLTWTQHEFNEKAGKIQRVANEAFLRLKGRWSCLQKKTEVKLQDLPVVIDACCVLHNICEMRNEAMDPSKKSFHLLDHKIVICAGECCEVC